jgi:hypothetical protein
VNRVLRRLRHTIGHDHRRVFFLHHGLFAGLIPGGRRRRGGGQEQRRVKQPNNASTTRNLGGMTRVRPNDDDSLMTRSPPQYLSLLHALAMADPGTCIDCAPDAPLIAGAASSEHSKAEPVSAAANASDYDALNPATFVAPQHPIAPSVTIEFCNRRVLELGLGGCGLTLRRCRWLHRAMWYVTMAHRLSSRSSSRLSGLAQSLCSPSHLLPSTQSL